jgi:signal peptidase I
MEENKVTEIPIDEVVKEKKRTTVKQEILSWIKTIVGTFVVVLLIRRFIFMAVEVQGASMAPTFSDRQRIIVWQLFYTPELFDVIVLEHTDGNHHIKRVLGTPGDRVDYIEGEMFINNELIDEPYIMQEPSRYGFNLEGVCQFDCSVIPEGYFLVLGDNRNNSGDSREYGLVHESQIMGRVVLRFWPLSEFRMTSN